MLISFVHLESFRKCAWGNCGMYTHIKLSKHSNWILQKYLNVKFLLMIFNVKQIVHSTDDNGKSNLFVILKSIRCFDNPKTSPDSVSVNNFQSREMQGGILHFQLQRRDRQFHLVVVHFNVNSIFGF